MKFANHYRGPQVGPGWFRIVEELEEALEGMPIRILQIKEKFGQLRVYYEYETPASHEQAVLVSQVLQVAADKAAKTCEICGEPGKLSNINVLGVRCETHAND